MHLKRLWLSDFRSHESVTLDLPAGLTFVCGPNGIGKTNLLEAVGFLATMKSFRGATTETMIRSGASSAVIRAEGERDGRELLIELELGKGKTRAQINRQRLRRGSDLLGALRVTVFAPDDLALVKGGPKERRRFLDDLLVSLDPQADTILVDMERTLKHRNALLRQAHGRISSEIAMTLDVWDDRLATTGQTVTERRESLVASLMPYFVEAYEDLSRRSVNLCARYQRSWQGDCLGDALKSGRSDDARRGVTLIGPHRDDLELSLEAMAARNTASQGEQRTIALALRLAGHRLVTARLGEPPLLLLDDVLSEFDDQRSEALMLNLPQGQAIITSATVGPAADKAERFLQFDSTGQLPLD